MREIARAVVGEELLILFPYSFVAILQPDGSQEVARVD